MQIAHAMTNAFELKKFYKHNNEYYNYIIVKDKAFIDKVMKYLRKLKFKKLSQIFLSFGYLLF